jgi:hypothetical protein
MKATQEAVRDAERRFPVRVTIAAPHEGLGGRLDQIITWLDALRCGWLVVDPIEHTRRRQRCARDLFRRRDDFSAFVARWCVAQKVEIVDGVYRVRDDEPPPRIGAALHRTP